MKAHGVSQFRRQLCLIAFASISMAGCLSGSGGGGEEGLSVHITAPDAVAIDTTDETFTVEGTANSPGSITSVTWENDLGGEGTAAGTDSWQITNIPLALGANKITVSVTDDLGGSTSDVITVNRESAYPGSITLSWNAPSERVDGTPLNELAGYRISYGRMTGVYDYELEIDNPGLQTYVVENLAPGEWYFVVSAIDIDGLESDYSNEAYTQIL